MISDLALTSYIEVLLLCPFAGGCSSLCAPRLTLDKDSIHLWMVDVSIDNAITKKVKIAQLGSICI